MRPQDEREHLIGRLADALEDHDCRYDGDNWCATCELLTEARRAARGVALRPEGGEPRLKVAVTLREWADLMRRMFAGSHRHQWAATTLEDAAHALEAGGFEDEFHLGGVVPPVPSGESPSDRL